MARFEGPIVAALQGVAAENWLECCGEILTGPGVLPEARPAGDATAFVVKSSPVGSRDRVARGVPAADGRRRSRSPHQHAVFPAGPGAAAGARSSIAAARRRTSSVIVPGRARPISDGCVWPAGGCGASCSRPASGSTSIAARMTHAKVLDRRRPVGGARHDQHRQPIVRAQRRGQRRRCATRASPRGCSRTTGATSQDSDEMTLAAVAARGRCGRKCARPRSSGFWSGSSERPRRQPPHRRPPHRHLQHPPLPRHGSPHLAARIAEVLRDINADVVALQEVIGAGPAGAGQAEEIGAALGMGWVMTSVRHLRQHLFGNVSSAASRSPTTASTTCRGGRASRAPASAPISISAPAGVLHVYNVHLGTAVLERRYQAPRLASYVHDHRIERPEDHPRRLQRMDARAGDQDAVSSLFESIDIHVAPANAAAPTRASSRWCTSITSTTRATSRCAAVELPRTPQGADGVRPPAARRQSAHRVQVAGSSTCSAAC